MPKLTFIFKYIPALDGLRGIAILSVMFFHSSILHLQGGFVGVDIFFVLSGFLITSLLINEFNKTGSINFRNFYIKRILRLMPAMLLLLGCLWSAVFIMGGRFATTPQGLLSASLFTFFYFANWAIILGLTNWPAAITHFWSLAIEEQFYILWPTVFFLLLQYNVKIKKVIAALLVACTLLIAWRIYLFSSQVSFSRVYFATDTRLCSMLFGCILSIVVCYGFLPIWFKRFSGHIIAASLFALTLCIFLMNNSLKFTYYGGFEIVALATCMLIAASIFSQNWFTKILSSKVLVWFGKLSYGIYLWHGVIFYFFEKIQISVTNSSIVLFALQFGTSLIAASASYYLFELWFLKLKSRLVHKNEIGKSKDTTDFKKKKVIQVNY